MTVPILYEVLNMTYQDGVLRTAAGDSALAEFSIDATGVPFGTTIPPAEGLPPAPHTHADGAGATVPAIADVAVKGHVHHGADPVFSRVLEGNLTAGTAFQAPEPGLSLVDFAKHRGGFVASYDDGSVRYLDRTGAPAPGAALVTAESLRPAEVIAPADGLEPVPLTSTKLADWDAWAAGYVPEDADAVVVDVDPAADGPGALAAALAAAGAVAGGAGGVVLRGVLSAAADRVSVGSAWGGAGVGVAATSFAGLVAHAALDALDLAGAEGHAVLVAARLEAVPAGETRTLGAATRNGVAASGATLGAGALFLLPETVMYRSAGRNGVVAVTLSGDGEAAAGGSFLGEVRALDPVPTPLAFVAGTQLLAAGSDGAARVAVSPDSLWVAVHATGTAAGGAGSVRMFRYAHDAAAGESRWAAAGAPVTLPAGTHADAEVLARPRFVGNGTLAVGGADWHAFLALDAEAGTWAATAADAVSPGQLVGALADRLAVVRDPATGAVRTVDPATGASTPLDVNVGVASRSVDVLVEGPSLASAPAAVTGLAMWADGLAVAGADGSVRVYDRDFAERQVLSGVNAASLAVSGDGLTLAVGREGGQGPEDVRVFRQATAASYAFAEEADIQMFPGTSMPASFAAASSLVASASASNLIAVARDTRYVVARRDASTGAWAIDETVGAGELPAQVTCVALSPDGAWMAVAHGDTATRVVHVASGAATDTTHAEPSRDVALGGGFVYRGSTYRAARHALPAAPGGALGAAEYFETHGTDVNDAVPFRVVAGADRVALALTEAPGPVPQEARGLPVAAPVIASLADDTFVVPAGVTELSVSLLGGGGGGSADQFAGGGSGGGQVFGKIAVSAGDVVAWSVGTGGGVETGGGDTVLTRNGLEVARAAGGTAGSASGPGSSVSGTAPEGMVAVTSGVGTASTVPDTVHGRVWTMGSSVGVAVENESTGQSAVMMTGVHATSWGVSDSGIDSAVSAAQNSDIAAFKSFVSGIGSTFSLGSAPSNGVVRYNVATGVRLSYSAFKIKGNLQYIITDMSGWRDTGDMWGTSWGSSTGFAEYSHFTRAIQHAMINREDIDYAVANNIPVILHMYTGLSSDIGTWTYEVGYGRDRNGYDSRTVGTARTDEQTFIMSVSYWSKTLGKAVNYNPNSVWYSAGRVSGTRELSSVLGLSTFSYTLPRTSSYVVPFSDITSFSPVPRPIVTRDWTVVPDVRFVSDGSLGDFAMGVDANGVAKFVGRGDYYVSGVTAYRDDRPIPSWTNCRSSGALSGVRLDQILTSGPGQSNVVTAVDDTRTRVFTWGGRMSGSYPTNLGYQFTGSTSYARLLSFPGFTGKVVDIDMRGTEGTMMTNGTDMWYWGKIVDGSTGVTTYSYTPTLVDKTGLPAGATIVSVTIQNTRYVGPFGFVVTGDGELYARGYFNDNVNFIGNGGNSYYVTGYWKLMRTGIRWVKGVRGTSSNFLCTTDGVLKAWGSQVGVLGLGAYYSSNRAYSPLPCLFDVPPTGVPISVAGDASGLHVAVFSSGQVYTTGKFGNTVNFSDETTTWRIVRDLPSGWRVSLPIAPAVGGGSANWTGPNAPGLGFNSTATAPGGAGGYGAGGGGAGSGQPGTVLVEYSDAIDYSDDGLVALYSHADLSARVGALEGAPGADGRLGASIALAGRDVAAAGAGAAAVTIRTAVHGTEIVDSEIDTAGPFLVSYTPADAIALEVDVDPATGAIAAVSELGTVTVAAGADIAIAAVGADGVLAVADAAGAVRVFDALGADALAAPVATFAAAGVERMAVANGLVFATSDADGTAVYDGFTGALLEDPEPPAAAGGAFDRDVAVSAGVMARLESAPAGTAARVELTPLASEGMLVRARGGQRVGEAFVAPTGFGRALAASADAATVAVAHDRGFTVLDAAGQALDDVAPQAGTLAGAYDIKVSHDAAVVVVAARPGAAALSPVEVRAPAVATADATVLRTAACRDAFAGVVRDFGAGTVAVRVFDLVGAPVADVAGPADPDVTAPGWGRAVAFLGDDRRRIAVADDAAVTVFDLRDDGGGTYVPFETIDLADVDKIVALPGHPDAFAALAADGVATTFLLADPADPADRYGNGRRTVLDEEAIGAPALRFSDLCGTVAVTNPLEDDLAADVDPDTPMNKTPQLLGLLSNGRVRTMVRAAPGDPAWTVVDPVAALFGEEEPEYAWTYTGACVTRTHAFLLRSDGEVLRAGLTRSGLLRRELADGGMPGLSAAASPGAAAGTLGIRASDRCVFVVGSDPAAPGRVLALESSVDADVAPVAIDTDDAAPAPVSVSSRDVVWYSEDSGELVRTIHPHPASVPVENNDGDGPTLVSAWTRYDQLRFTDDSWTETEVVSQWRLAQAVAFAPGDEVTGVAVSPDGRRFAVAHAGTATTVGGTDVSTVFTSVSTPGMTTRDVAMTDTLVVRGNSRESSAYRVDRGDTQALFPVPTPMANEFHAANDGIPFRLAANNDIVVVALPEFPTTEAQALPVDPVSGEAAPPTLGAAQVSASLPAESGIFTVPDGVTQVTVAAVGPGEAGRASGGGGGGGVAWGVVAVEPGEKLVYELAAGATEISRKATGEVLARAEAGAGGAGGQASGAVASRAAGGAGNVEVVNTEFVRHVVTTSRSGVVSVLDGNRFVMTRDLDATVLWTPSAQPQFLSVTSLVRRAGADALGLVRASGTAHRVVYRGSNEGMITGEYRYTSSGTTADFVPCAGVPELEGAVAVADGSSGYIGEAFFAVTADGLWSWGSGYYLTGRGSQRTYGFGQVPLPLHDPASSPLVDWDLSGDHKVVTDGQRLWAWGYKTSDFNRFTPIEVPTKGLRLPLRSVAAMTGVITVVDAIGRVMSFGRTGLNGNPNVGPGVARYQRLYRHTNRWVLVDTRGKWVTSSSDGSAIVYATEDGDVFAWGDSSTYGSAIGIGTTAGAAVPRPLRFRAGQAPAPGAHAVAADVGRYASVLLYSDGTLYECRAGRTEWEYVMYPSALRGAPVSRVPPEGGAVASLGAGLEAADAALAAGGYGRGGLPGAPGGPGLALIQYVGPNDYDNGNVFVYDARTLALREELSGPANPDAKFGSKVSVAGHELAASDVNGAVYNFSALSNLAKEAMVDLGVAARGRPVMSIDAPRCDSATVALSARQGSALLARLRDLRRQADLMIGAGEFETVAATIAALGARVRALGPHVAANYAETAVISSTLGNQLLLSDMFALALGYGATVSYAVSAVSGLDGATPEEIAAIAHESVALVTDPDSGATTEEKIIQLSPNYRGTEYKLRVTASVTVPGYGAWESASVDVTVSETDAEPPIIRAEVPETTRVEPTEAEVDALAAAADGGAAFAGGIDLDTVFEDAAGGAMSYALQSVTVLRGAASGQASRVALAADGRTLELRPSKYDTEYNVTVRGTNEWGKSANYTFVVVEPVASAPAVVGADAPAVSTTTFLPGVEPYEYDMSQHFSSPSGALTFSLAAGASPAQATIDAATGLLRVTPDYRGAASTYFVTVVATNPFGAASELTLSFFEETAPAPALTASAPGAAVTVDVSDGMAPVTYPDLTSWFSDTVTLDGTPIGDVVVSVSDPAGHATVVTDPATGSATSLTIDPDFRNASYDLTVTASNRWGSQQSVTLSVAEPDAPAPVLASVTPDVRETGIVFTAEDGLTARTVALSFVDTTGDGQLALALAEPSDPVAVGSATLSADGTLTVTPAFRDATYELVATATNRWGKATSVTLSVTEPYLPRVVLTEAGAALNGSTVTTDAKQALAQTWDLTTLFADDAGRALTYALSGDAATIPTTVTQVSAGVAHAAAVRSDGALFTWGANEFGEGAGDGTTLPAGQGITAPANASGLTGVVSASCGHTWTVAALADGTVWAWGKDQDNHGVLGNGAAGDSATPVQVQGFGPSDRVIKVVAGWFAGYAITDDGRVFSWGANWDYQCGRSGSTESMAAEISGLSDVVDVSAGHSHALALTSGGQLYGWGRNSANATGASRSTPALVTSSVLADKQVVAIGCGGWHSLVALSDGTVAAVGNSTNGELGDGLNQTSSAIVLVSGLPAGATVERVDAGENQSLAVLSTGEVYAWGRNELGQLGDNTTTHRWTAVQADTSQLPAGSGGVAAVSAGGYFAVATLRDGTLASWGTNGAGRLGRTSGGGYKRPGAVDDMPLPMTSVGAPAALSGSTLTYTPAFRDASLGVTVTATNPDALSESLTFTVSEPAAPAPLLDSFATTGSSPLFTDGTAFTLSRYTFADATNLTSSGTFRDETREGLVISASSPYGNVVVSGTSTDPAADPQWDVVSFTLVTAPAYRDTSYDVTVKATNAYGKTATWTLPITEPTPPPVTLSAEGASIDGTTVLTTSQATSSYTLVSDLRTLFSSTAPLTFTENHSFTWISGNALVCALAYRGTTWSVTVTASTAYGTSASLTLSVTEGAAPTPYLSSGSTTFNLGTSSGSVLARTLTFGNNLNNMAFVELSDPYGNVTLTRLNGSQVQVSVSGAWRNTSYTYQFRASNGYKSVDVSCSVSESANLSITSAQVNQACSNFDLAIPNPSNLLYRASRDGWSNATFHILCDSAPMTLTLVRWSTGNISAGYTATSWSGSGYKKDPNAKLTNLVDNWGYANQVYPISNTRYSIYTNSGYGPTFGNGHDLAVDLDTKTGYCYAAGYDYSGQRSGYSMNNMSGLYSSSVGIDEVEVWLVAEDRGLMENGPSIGINPTTLHFRATRDGWDTTTMYNNTPGGNVYFVCKTAEGYILGGYVSINPKQSAGYHSDSNAFIFRLDSPTKGNQQVYNGWSLYQYSYYVPSTGSLSTFAWGGGNDLKFTNMSTVTVRNSGGSGYSYQSIGPENGSTYNYNIVEFEVWS